MRLRKRSSAGVQGPRFGEDSSYVYLAWIADSMTYGSTIQTAGAASYFSATDVRGGPVYDEAWSSGSGYTFLTGMDFWANDLFHAFATGVTDGTDRSLVTTVTSVAAGRTASLLLSRTTSATFDDVEMVEDAAGDLQVVGCDAGSGILAWMHGTPAEIYAGTGVGDEIAAATSDACVPWPDATSVYASIRASRGWRLYGYSDATGLTYTSAESPHGTYDFDTLTEGGRTVLVWADGAAGITVRDAGAEAPVPTATATQLSVDQDSAGTLYVASTDTSGSVWLSYGDVASGFATVTVDPGMGGASAVAVHVSAGDQLLMAVRYGDTIAWMALDLR